MNKNLLWLICVALKKAGGLIRMLIVCFAWLTASKTVQSSSLSLQSVDDVHSGDGLSLGVLSVRDSVSDHILQEHLEHTPRLFIDQAGNTLDSTTAS